MWLQLVVAVEVTGEWQCAVPQHLRCGAAVRLRLGAGGSVGAMCKATWEAPGPSAVRDQEAPPSAGDGALAPRPKCRAVMGSGGAGRGRGTGPAASRLARNWTIAARLLTLR